MDDIIHFHVNLFGPFEATSSRGETVVVTSKRGRALFAVLATGRKQQRTRDWVQALLWPGREKAQASASLRQELRGLNKMFGVSDLILREHGLLGLNPERVTVTVDSVPVGALAVDFMEGLHLHAPFDAWVAEHRDRLSQPVSGAQEAKAPPAPQARSATEVAGQTHEPVLYLNRQTSSELELEVANEVFQAHIEKGLSDLAPLDLRHVQDQQVAQEQTLLKTQLVKVSHEALLRVVLQGQPPLAAGWSASWSGPREALTQCDDDTLMQLAFRAQEAAIDALSTCAGRQNQMSASLFAFRALQNVFSMERAALEQADRDFQTAYAHVPKGVFKAWRGFIQANLIVENTDLDAAAQADLAARLVREALQDEPENAALKAAAAHVFLLTGQDVRAAGALARDATVLNPANPLGWASRANAEIAAGQVENSVRFSNRALEIGRFSKSRHWWEMQAGVSAALSGNLKAARDHSLIAHSLVPSFRPPLRYLTALENTAGNSDATEIYAQKLQDVEADFEVQNLSEPGYPSGNLRRAGLA